MNPTCRRDLTAKCFVLFVKKLWPASENRADSKNDTSFGRVIFKIAKRAVVMHAPILLSRMSPFFRSIWVLDFAVWPRLDIYVLTLPSAHLLARLNAPKKTVRIRKRPRIFLFVRDLLTTFRLKNLSKVPQIDCAQKWFRAITFWSVVLLVLVFRTILVTGTNLPRNMFFVKALKLMTVAEGPACTRGRDKEKRPPSFQCDEKCSF